jgi:hypothetical protein
MQTKIEKALALWHKHFEDEEYQYSEFESSDIEYFVGCLLYNHFKFSKALDTMKTIDLSYDFLESCGEEEYQEVLSLIHSIELNTDEEKLKFLQNYIQASQQKYNADELYLLNRLSYHVNEMAQRYATGSKTESVDFEALQQPRSPNPLLR